MLCPWLFYHRYLHLTSILIFSAGKTCWLNRNPVVVVIDHTSTLVPLEPAIVWQYILKSLESLSKEVLCFITAHYISKGKSTLKRYKIMCSIVLYSIKICSPEGLLVRNLKNRQSDLSSELVLSTKQISPEAGSI